MADSTSQDPNVADAAAVSAASIAAGTKAAAALGKKPIVNVAPVASPAGWWKLPGWAGSRNGVKAAITVSNCPLHWAEAISRQIDALDPKFNFLKVDAHYHVHDDGKQTLHLTLSPSVALA